MSLNTQIIPNKMLNLVYADSFDAIYIINLWKTVRMKISNIYTSQQ